LTPLLKTLNGYNIPNGLRYPQWAGGDQDTLTITTFGKEIDLKLADSNLDVQWSSVPLLLFIFT